MEKEPTKSKVDLFIDEAALLGGGKAQKKAGTVSHKATPKDVILNGLSAIAVMGVVLLCNLFISPDFHYTQLYSWEFGVLIVVNWVCGIMMTYFLRQSGINTARMTTSYVESESDKQKAFSQITDFQASQERLDTLIEKDFEHRKTNLELAISKLVQHLMIDGEKWDISKPLPKKTPLRVRKMARELKHMTPPQINLVALAQSEASYNVNSLYDVRPAPEKTGTVWFIRKGSGKVGWFAVAPFVLSILANGLVGGFNIANIVQTIGIVGVMLFNAAREYTVSYAAVARFGVDRNRQIVQIINSVTRAQSVEHKAEKLTDQVEAQKKVEANKENPVNALVDLARA